MMRFRVIKAGTLLLAASVVILAIVVAVIVISMLGKSDDAAPTAVQVFTDSQSALIPIPINIENEHTDSKTERGNEEADHWG